MSTRDDGGPAFPVFAVRDQDGIFQPITAYLDVGGMTLRDYFAAKAMQGMFANKDWDTATYKQHAECAYDMADAMLKARQS